MKENSKKQQEKHKQRQKFFVDFVDFIITMQLTYVLGNYYDLHKYH